MGIKRRAEEPQGVQQPQSPRNDEDIIDLEFKEADDDDLRAPAESVGKASHSAIGRVPKRPLYRRWLIWICVLAIGSGAFVYYRQLTGSRQDLARAEHACGRSGWRTSVTLDRSRPEFASTTLRSQNALGRPIASRCVDISFACLKEGPYFEIRMDPSGPRIKEIKSFLVERAGDYISVSLSGQISEAGNAIRVSEKTTVEVLASVLDGSNSFGLPLTFEDGENAVAQFSSFDFFRAVGPVLLTCKMRFFRSGKGEAEHDPD